MRQPLFSGGWGKNVVCFFFGVVFVAKDSGALVDCDEAASNLHHSWRSETTNSISPPNYTPLVSDFASSPPTLLGCPRKLGNG